MERSSHHRLRTRDVGTDHPGGSSAAVGNGDDLSALAIPEADASFAPPGQTDETPTIISKNHPVVAENSKPPPRDSLANSLRGRHLAHFELIEPIGVGGMAAVIRALDTQLDRFVALKILPPEMAVEGENVQRFHQEARAAAKLDHENIARVFYCGEDQRLHFIAFEFVEGENLRTILDKRGRLPVGEAVRYLLQIAMGLEHAASRGVVHRDIKPSNIIITPTGKAKLVDMGLARSLEPQNAPQLTQSGMTLGTFDYISPEQALEPRDADSRSDIYSLGCTFYHMLTGRPPVPEGTAAKKLHHHQHVAPLDPRQLYPEIPDEVAMILSKMIAKESRNRYQRPIYLVQHLMQIAQEVGATADLPEGGLVIEAPLPIAARKRPLLFVSLAIIALGLQVFLIGLFSPRENVTPSTPPIAVRPPEKGKGATVKDGSAILKKSTPEKAGPAVITTEADLERVLSESGPDVYASLGGIIDIGENGLTYLGDERRSLTLESHSKVEPATLRFKLPANADVPGLLAGLVIEGGTVTIKNVRFEIEAPSTPRFASAALAVRGAATVKLIRCEFAQKDVPQRPLLKADVPVLPIASVIVENEFGGAESRPAVLLDQCYFYGTGPGGQNGGQVAVAINGPARVDAINCAFKPHGSLFHLRGNSKDFSTLVRLNQCSAFVYNGPAFRFDDEARCVLQVQNSIFSGPGSVDARWDVPHFLFQTKSREPLVRYEGHRNFYHNIWALWNLPSELGYRLVNNMDEFQQQVLLAGGKGDVGSSLKRDAPSIWESPTPLREDSPERAFALRPDVVEARSADLKTALGIEKCAWGDMHQPPYRAKEAIAGLKLGPNQILFDPDASTFFVAFGNAKPGDEILIKQPKGGREVKLGAFRLEKAGTDLTIKPYSKEDRPVLVLDKTSELDAAFFRLQDGRLHFEDLDFVLEPDPLQTNAQTRSLVLLGGSASCTFKNCGITLKPLDAMRPAGRVPLSVASLLNPAQVMKMGPKTARASPEIHFLDCFVRGEGDLLSVPTSRPFNLSVDNSLLALAGSVVDVLSPVKDVPSDSAAAVIKLNRTAVFSSEPVVALRGGKSGKTWYSHRVDEAKDCLFVNLNDRGLIPFLLVESHESRPENLRPLLDWKGGRNGYANYQRYFINVIPGELEPNIRLEQPEWVEYSGEAESNFPLKALIIPAPTMRSLWTATPDLFRSRVELSQELAEFGPNLSADLLLRLPAAVKEPSTPFFP